VTGLPLLNRRNFVLGGVLCAAAGVAYARTPKVVYPRIDKDQFETLIPNEVGPWRYESASGLVLPPADELSARLYDCLVTRVYSREGMAPMMMLAAYNNVQDGMLQVHRPEICYPAGGYQLSNTSPLTISNGIGGELNANHFSANGVDRSEQVMYWTRVGNKFPVTWTQQRLAVIEANLTGKIPDAILVRFSSPLASMDDALPAMTDFAAHLVAEMNGLGRRLFVGA